MREDRDRVDFPHGTLSMITGPSRRGLSHLDGAALQASYERPALSLQAHSHGREPQNLECGTAANQVGHTQNPSHGLLFEVDPMIPEGFLSM